MISVIEFQALVIPRGDALPARVIVLERVGFGTPGPLLLVERIDVIGRPGVGGYGA